VGVAVQQPRQLALAQVVLVVTVSAQQELLTQAVQVQLELVQMAQVVVAQEWETH
jgi:hypothetical protein